MRDRISAGETPLRQRSLKTLIARVAAGKGTIRIEGERSVLAAVAGGPAFRVRLSQIWSEMARLDGETSNELFEVLADWNTQLEHLRRKPPVPPCP